MFNEFVESVVAVVESHEDFRAVIRDVHYRACRIIHNNEFAIPLVGVINGVDSTHFQAVGRGESPQEAARSALGFMADGVPAEIVEYIMGAFEPLLRVDEVVVVVGPVVPEISSTRCLWEQFKEHSAIYEAWQVGKEAGVRGC